MRYNPCVQSFVLVARVLVAVLFLEIFIPLLLDTPGNTQWLYLSHTLIKSSICAHHFCPVIHINSTISSHNDKQYINGGQLGLWEVCSMRNKMAL